MDGRTDGMDDAHFPIKISAINQQSNQETYNVIVAFLSALRTQNDTHLTLSICSYEFAHTVALLVILMPLLCSLADMEFLLLPGDTCLHSYD